MKLLLLGATGRTGRELLAGALARGHRVSALARDPTRLAVRDERVQVIAGSATDEGVLDEAVVGQDAVLCALGPRSATELVHCELMRSSIPGLVAAMERHRARRLLLLSALGAGESRVDAPALLRLAFATALREVGMDKARAEQAVHTSDLDWTVVYPPTLTDGSATGNYRHAEGLRLRGLPRISRRDVAEFMLAQLTDGQYRRKGVIIGPSGVAHAAAN